MISSLVGLAKSAKFCGLVTFRITVVVRRRSPLRPTMVTVYVPAGVAKPVRMVSADESASLLIVWGSNDADASDGSPSADKSADGAVASGKDPGNRILGGLSRRTSIRDGDAER